MAETQAAPKGSGGLAKFVVVVILLAVIGNVCNQSGSTRTSTPAQLASRPSVVLEIYGIGDITYNNASGNTEQRSRVGRSEVWTTVDSFTTDDGEFLYVSIQNDLDFGTVQCRIIVDNETVEEASSNGAYVIASCSGSA